VTTSRRLAAILLGLTLVAGPAAATIFGTGDRPLATAGLTVELVTPPAAGENSTLWPPVPSSGGAVHVRAGLGGSPLSAVVQQDDGGGVSSASLGLASWYFDGAGLYAAVPGWQWGDTPYKLRVCHERKCVTVTVRDACRCPGSRLIDLSRDAFRRLAPLSAGVIVVTVTGGAAAGPLPATSTEAVR
jgi:hypothetical protein